MSDQEDWLKLQVGTAGEGINADGFLNFFQQAIAALKEIDKASSRHGVETIEWKIVEAGTNSPLFARIQGYKLPSVAPEKNGGAGPVITIFVSGIETLASGNRLPPRYNRKALLLIKQMSTIANYHRLSPTIATATKSTRIEESVAENADWALKADAIRKQGYFERGSLEGELLTLSSSAKQKRDTLVIVNRVTGEEITCSLASKDLEPLVREAWKRRVVVSGKIFVPYETRRPAKILVDHIRILPKRDDALGIEGLLGINITGGMESSEYVRRLRDVE
jgi:hypothetical protein